MYNDVLLISSDLTLASRLAKALATPPLAGRLTRLAPGEDLPASPPPLLLLWDDRAPRAPVPGAVAAAHQRSIPVVRLAGDGGAGRAEATDTVAGSDSLNKLIYVVRQRLTSGHLRQAQRRQAGLSAGAPAAALALGNLLSSLLGNAELVLQQSSRLPEESRQRLENIVGLALALRELLAPSAGEQQQRAA